VIPKIEKPCPGSNAGPTLDQGVHVRRGNRPNADR